MRIENIDTPELTHAQCDAEKILARLASDRLAELLNLGGWRLVQVGNRDHDRHGRKLRTVVTGSTDIGQTLIDEGLARPWTGRRQPWCGAPSS